MIRSAVVGKTGRIRLKGKALENLRRRVFERDGWHCRKCGRPCSWVTGHLAHFVSRGAGGSDSEENTRLLCSVCHHAEHNPKAVPPKPISQPEISHDDNDLSGRLAT